MKIYDTNYGPDTFGHIRMGLITEMFLTFEGFLKPEAGDQLRISCVFKGVVRDVYTVMIAEVCECVDEHETVLVRIQPKVQRQTEPTIDCIDDRSNVANVSVTFFQSNTVH